MQEIADIVLLNEASMDLEQAREFYNKLQMGVGDYFYDSLIADLESLGHLEKPQTSQTTLIFTHSKAQ